MLHDTHLLLNLPSVSTRTQRSGCNKRYIRKPVKKKFTGSVHGNVYNTKKMTEEVADKYIGHCTCLKFRRTSPPV